MKKSSALRPVSRNAYARFVQCITLVATDLRKCASMLKTLDKYLAGDRDTYADSLTADCAMAFEMLRFDIDLAIARSAKARMRARKNKSGQPSSADNVQSLPTPTCHGDAVHTDSIPPTVNKPKAVNKAQAEKSPQAVEKDQAEKDPQAVATSETDGQTAAEKKTEFVRPLTRRQRRMRERWEKPKMRWSKL